MYICVDVYVSTSYEHVYANIHLIVTRMFGTQTCTCVAYIGMYTYTRKQSSVDLLLQVEESDLEQLPTLCCVPASLICKA